MKKSISFFLTCLLLFNYTIVSAEPATEEGKDAQTEGLQIESSSAILLDKYFMRKMPMKGVLQQVLQK
jgi:hypothetical protein